MASDVASKARPSLWSWKFSATLGVSMAIGAMVEREKCAVGISIDDQETVMEMSRRCRSTVSTCEK